MGSASHPQTRGPRSVRKADDDALASRETGRTDPDRCAKKKSAAKNVGEKARGQRQVLRVRPGSGAYPPRAALIPLGRILFLWLLLLLAPLPGSKRSIGAWHRARRHKSGRYMVHRMALALRISNAEVRGARNRDLH